MRAIDLRHMGTPNVICTWVVDGVLIDPGPASSLETLLEGLGGERPEAILLTHIHLDHAGATGTLVRRWPDIRVHVHERGAPHMVDPSKLIASASRLYDDMDERWGEILPVPEANVHTIADGDTLHGFRSAHTPGHASHHVAFLHEDSGRAFVGDVAGIRIPDADFTLMPTPPPDIDVEAWQRSISLVESWQPTALALTHFGPHENVGGLAEAAREQLSRFAQDARDGDRDGFLERMEAEIAARTKDDLTAEIYRQAAPPQLQFAGLERYWRKRAERLAG